MYYYLYQICYGRVDMILFLRFLLPTMGIACGLAAVILPVSFVLHMYGLACERLSEGSWERKEARAARRRARQALKVADAA
jgi:hypothetical protein